MQPCKRMRQPGHQNENCFQDILPRTVACVGTGRPSVFTYTEPPEKVQGHWNQQLSQRRNWEETSRIRSARVSPITKASQLGLLGATRSWHKDKRWSTRGGRSPGTTPHPPLLVDRRVTKQGLRKDKARSEHLGPRPSDLSGIHHRWRRNPFPDAGGAKRTPACGRLGLSTQASGFSRVSLHTHPSVSVVASGPQAPPPPGRHHHNCLSTWVLFPDHVRCHEPCSVLWEAV